MDKITLNFDGSCEPVNPGGNMGFGVVIKKNGVVIHHGNGFEPRADTNSNNVAEYRALLLGLEWLHANGYMDAQIEVLGDSQLVIMQMSGAWRAKGGMYFDTFQACKELAYQFTNLSFRWIPRAQNNDADQLSRKSVEIVE